MGLFIFLLVVLVIAYVLAGGGKEGASIVLYGVGLCIIIGLVTVVSLVL